MTISTKRPAFIVHCLISMLLGVWVTLWCAVPVHAGITVDARSRSVTLHVKGLSRDASVTPTPSGPALHLRSTLDARRLIPRSPLTAHCLEYSLRVPQDGAVSPELVVTAWKTYSHTAGDTTQIKERAEIVQRGRASGVSLATLRIVPWRVRSGVVEIADTFSVIVTFERSLQVADPQPHASTLAPLLNPRYADVTSGKRATRVQERAVDPTRWYEPGQPYVALSTSRDGIARITAADLIALEPRFNSAVIAELRLTLHGREVPLHVASDRDGRLNDGDEVFFLGRRPFGDTTYWDRYDTVATFMLTLKPGERLRYEEWGDPGSTTALEKVMVHEHIEYDTGYYHLGSHPNPIFSEYLTDWAPLEGYYWSAMNFRTYDRLRYQLQAEPFASETRARLSLWFAGVTNLPEFAPEHLLSFKVNGGSAAKTASTGYLQDSVVNDDVALGSGLNSFMVYAQGREDLRDSTRYVSQVVVDRLTASYEAKPWLIRGALTFQRPPIFNRTLDLKGARTQRVFMIDTLAGAFAEQLAEERHQIIRASSMPTDAAWATLEPDQIRRRLQLEGNGKPLDVQVTDTLIIAITTAGKTQFIGTDDPVVMTRQITSLPPGAHVAFACWRIPLSTDLRLALVASGAPEVTTDNAVCAWVVGSTVGISDQSFDARLTSIAAAFSDPQGPYRSTTMKILPASSASAMIFVADEVALERPRLRVPVLQNLQATSGQADVLYVTTPKYRAEVDRLAQHRRDHDSLSTMVFEMPGIFDEYAHGQHTPFALKAFLTDVYARLSAPKPRYLLLVGNASFDPRIAIPRGNLNSSRPDEVPTFGRPTSDYWFGLLDGDDVAFPELEVGRLPVVTQEECRIVVDKIIQHDMNVQAPWHRKFFFVGGGEPDEGFCDMYESLLSDPFGTGITVTGPPLCLDTVTLCKADAPQTAGFRIKQTLNDGVAWMNYLGHGATDQYDITGWDPNELNNGTQQGFMATYACQTGAYATPSTLCKNARYLIEPDAGMIGTVGGTGWTFIETVANLFYGFHDAIRTSGLRRIGDVVYVTKTRLASGGDQDGINTAMQQSILGDPLSHIRIDSEQDLYTRSQDVRVTNADGEDVITEEDGVMLVKATVQNAGTGNDVPVEIEYRRVFGDDTTTVRDTIETGVCVRDSSFAVLSFKQGQIGRHVITITIDPDSVLPRERRYNNIYTVAVDVLGRSLLPVEPQSYWTMPMRGAVFRTLFPSVAASEEIPECVIARSADTTDIIVASRPEEIVTDAVSVSWSPTEPLNDVSDVWFGARLRDPRTDQTSAWTWVPFSVSVVPVTDDRIVVVQNAARMQPEDAQSIALDGDMLVLRSKSSPVYVRSIGIQPASGLTYSPVRIEVGAITYVNEFWKRGVNIVVVANNDTVPRIIRRYDTYKDPIPVGEGFNAGGTKECIAFLRDSIQDGETLLLALCDESISGFQKDTTLDDLIEVLHTYGSQYADSLDLNASFALASVRNGELISEQWKGWPDTTAVVSYETLVTTDSATVRTERFGPARTWTSLTAAVRGTVRTDVYGTNTTGEERLLTTLTGYDSYDAIPSDIVSIRTTSTMTRQSSSEYSQSIAYTSATFSPASEWTIVPGTIMIDPDSVLRGDTSILSVRVRNPYVRFTADNTTSLVSLLDQDGASTSSFNVPEQSFDADEEREIRIAVPSAAAPPNCTVRFDLNVDLVPELYRFNDRAATVWSIAQDTVAPSIEVRIDSLVAYDGMWVLQQPFMEVLLRDNSKLPVNDSTKLLVYVNGDRMRPAVATDFAYYPTIPAILRYSDTTVRSAMTYRYPLDLGQNNVSVRAQDATGNATTYDIAVFTTDRTDLRDVTVSPNPFSSTTSFRFDLASDKASVPGRVLVYDLQGRLVRSITADLPFGRGSVEWDGRSNEGLSLATGAYAWRFVADDPEGPSSRVGTCMLVR